MASAQECILAINGGSSSIRFALYHKSEPLKRRLHGKVERIGLPGANLTFQDGTAGKSGRLSFHAPNHRSAAKTLIDWLQQQTGPASIKAVGHRVVHGMRHTQPEKITQKLLDKLHRIKPYDPEHLPGEIELIEAIRKRHPILLQVACFDTAFHRTMPRVARLLPIPRKFQKMGMERYGFHGLSYSYLVMELARVAGRKAARGRVVLAHLGNGASLAAVVGGKSIDTSMGFTPTAGLPMSTRSGDLDPGVAPFLARTQGMTTQQFYDMASHKSGLLGISGTSPDMRDLLSRESKDIRAAEAVELFLLPDEEMDLRVHGAMGGLETIVFAGGIGENAPIIRARICQSLEFMGIKLNARRNSANAPVISANSSPVTVRVMRTDEEVMIAGTLWRILNSRNLK